MKTYINTQQAQVPSYNLEVASNAFNKLNEGHIQSIQAQSELQSAVAQLDLNEAEEDFRQQLVNEIDSTVKENTRYGNAYFALPDIIAKAGNINSNPELIGRLRAQQAYKANIAAIDAKSNGDNSWEVVIAGGRKKTGLDAVSWAKTMEEFGAGEILLTSMDKDGMKTGYDIALTKAVSQAVTIPVIASGGVGTMEHFYEGFKDGYADAALAASVFHFQEMTIMEVKEYLKNKNIPVRI